MRISPRVVVLWLASTLTLGTAACQNIDKKNSSAPDSTKTTEALDKSTESYINKALLVRPFHGYGWTEARPDGDTYRHSSIDPPEPFTVQLIRLWSFKGTERRGGVAKIAQPGHSYDGYWVVFSTRHEGTFNFTDKPGHYNVDISSTEPRDNQEGWPTTQKGIKPEIGAQGWGEIVAVSQ